MALLSNLFFPRTCPQCGLGVGKKTARGRLCESCLRRLPRTEQAVLKQNETELTLADKRLERAAAFLFYEKDHPIQRVVHQMKYADMPEIGYQLGRQAALEWQDTEFFADLDVIVPMPLHPRRLRERGYNQSEYIARGISEVTGVPVDTSHVLRSRNTPKQALQDGEDRRQNVADAFAVVRPEQLYRKRILVVDDLITTGETMKACLKAMRVIRGARISVFALCKAR